MTKRWACPVCAKGACTHMSRLYVDAKVEAETQRETAQELARVLLEVEWSWRDGSACPVCNEYAHGETEAPGGHAPDCALDAALRKAGVR